MRKYLIAVGLGLILGIAGLLGLRGCLKSPSSGGVPARNEELKPNEKEKVIEDFGARTVTRLTRVETKDSIRSERSVAVGVRSVVRTVVSDGSVREVIQTRGFIHELGIGIGQDQKTRILLDCQIAYWGRWGVNVGVGIPFHREDGLRGFVGGSFTPGLRWLPNTGLVVGVDNRKELLVGIRTRF